MNHLAKLLLVSVAACATTGPDTALTFSVRDADRIGGTYEANGIAIAFDFSREGDRHVLTFRGTDGRPLITTTLDGPLQTTTVLGGRLVVSGLANAPNPAIEGDRAALEELHSLPEAGLLENLHDALAGAEIDAELYEPKPPAFSGVTNYDGYYFLFSPGETNVWYSFSGSTRVQVENRWPTAGACAAVQIEPWSATASLYMVVAPHAATVRYPGWALQLFTVRNMSTPVATCQPAPVLVHVDP